MYRYSVPIGLGILMVGAMVAYLLTAPAPVIGATSPPQISPFVFDLMLKAKDLPVESFDAI